MDEKTLIQHFGRQLSEGFGALFVGAGVSKPSKVPDWLSLMKPLAKDYLGVEINENDDLAEIAQFIVNHCGGNRGPIVGHFQRELQKPFASNPQHRAIAHMNVSTLWTTNYDNLLEDSLRADHLRVKTFSNDDSVARQTADFDVEVVKMHGSIDSSPQSDLVITQEDYEEFFVRRPATADLLKGHLLTKSFLFLGYSYRDTNIRNVLVQARRLATDAPRQHFLIAGKTDTLEKQKRQQLWSENLKRVGIEVVLMENFDRFDAVLAEIARVSRGNTVFITGSHKEASSNLASELGTLLAEQDMIVLIDGQSDGISRTAIASFVHTGVHQKKDIHNRLRIFPNPYAANPRFESDEDLLPELKKWRAPLIRATHVLVAFPGGMGTGTEVNLARELDCRIVPVPIEKNDSSALLMAAPEKYLSDEYKAKAANFQLTAAHIANEVKSLLCVTG